MGTGAARNRNAARDSSSRSVPPDSGFGPAGQRAGFATVSVRVERRRPGRSPSYHGAAPPARTAPPPIRPTRPARRRRPAGGRLRHGSGPARAAPLRPMPSRGSQPGGPLDECRKSVGQALKPMKRRGRFTHGGVATEGRARATDPICAKRSRLADRHGRNKRHTWRSQSGRESRDTRIARQSAEAGDAVDDRIGLDPRRRGPPA
jgi:hypothetical protein